jgi:hypothetical protein
MLSAALHYASLGLRVFPCEPRDKRPLGMLVPHGVKQATTDAPTLHRWWSREPAANVGIAVPDGVRVLDIDPKHGGDVRLASLIAQHGPLPTTPTALTGSGGHHHLFAGWPSCDLRTKLIAQDSGIELLGPGRYFVAAPSVHPSGGVYAWTTPLGPVAPAPVWLVALATRPVAPVHERPDMGPRAATGALLHAIRQIESAPDGDRNNTLNRMSYWIARIVREGHIGESLARDELIDAGCAAGMPAFEVRRTVESALRARRSA